MAGRPSFNPAVVFVLWMIGAYLLFRAALVLNETHDSSVPGVWGQAALGGLAILCGVLNKKRR